MGDHSQPGNYKVKKSPKMARVNNGLWPCMLAPFHSCPSHGSMTAFCWRLLVSNYHKPLSVGWISKPPLTSLV